MLQQDLKYAVRSLARNPGFATVAVLSLSLGIGANTAIFTLANAVFLNPLPVVEPSRLLELYTIDRAASTTANLGRTPMSFPNYEDTRAQNQTFSGLAAYLPARPAMTGLGEPKPQNVQLVSANYFDVLGVRLMLGRVFRHEEDRQPTPVAVVSYNFWQSQLAGDGAVVGRTVELNGVAYTIIGVAPRGFKGTLSIANPNLLWLPISMHSQVLPEPQERFFQERRIRLISVFGRLKPGVSEQQALANLQTIGTQLEREYPVANRGRSIDISSLAEATLAGARATTVRATFALAVVVGFVLLIACVNLANLLLARSAKRGREIGIRTALGAGRGRLLKQLLTESLLLAGAGGTGGLLVGWLGSWVLWRFRPPLFDPESVIVQIDARVFAFTLAVTLFTALIFGLAPAIRASVADLNSILKAGGRSGTENWGRNRFRATLVVGQITLAMIALVGAGLFIRSMRQAEQMDPGFEARNLFLLRFDLTTRRYAPARGREFLRSLVEQAETVPGVRGVALTSVPPLTPGLAVAAVTEGQDDPGKTRGILTAVNVVSASYFGTVGIPQRAGRAFTSADREGTQAVAVISASTARYYWPGQDPIGRRFRFVNEGFYRQVIGVVGDISAVGAAAQPLPIAYIPLEQNYQPSLALMVRTTADPAAVLKPVAAKVQRLDANLAFTDALTMPEVMSLFLWPPRASAALFGIFGVLGMVLAVLGIYGVMSYMVAQRTSEIGIRMALGARPQDVARLVVGYGARLALVGICIGIVAAAGLSRLMAGLLFGIGERDPLTYLAVSAILGGAALLAAWLPARHASRIDPLLALRQD